MRAPAFLDWLRRGGTTDRRTGKPLLSEAEMREIQNRLGLQGNRLIRDAHEVYHRLAGEMRSVYRGSGLDYEESRPYQPGDDLRYIHWRLSARTGETFTKVFREEKRPTLLLLVDRRPAMRFGTRTQLKVTLAARIAVVHALLALQEHLSVACYLLQDPPIWLPAKSSLAQAKPLIGEVIAPCPPLDAADRRPGLGETLRLLQHHLTAGSLVVLLSDFHDLQPTDRATLVGLQKRHNLLAYVVEDEAERDMPALPELALYGYPADRAVSVDARDAAWRETYRQAKAQRYDEIRSLLRAARIRHFRFDTRDTLDEILAHFPELLARL